ncbi:hypothetical protein BJ322DRAFT_1114551 [Thelephora terrestris]|uniref:Uncharacterized protein n=1 Tax=Thelephora terrestris TaxID=56493 RepID=A0A9P6L106_9AGAM|nr:hypothetical protein BJ322DRAFT_1114551 [Thelephora terrestris]
MPMIKKYMSSAIQHTPPTYTKALMSLYSVLKWHWAEEKIKWEENGGEVTKETFLKIYGEAHIRTLTPEIIRKVFEKTGVVPFNPDVISAEVMAPSKETSLEGPLPLAPSTPVRTAAASLHRLLHLSSEPDRHLSSSWPRVHGDMADLINHTICQLRDPGLTYLTR